MSTSLVLYFSLFPLIFFLVLLFWFPFISFSYTIWKILKTDGINVGLLPSGRKRRTWLVNGTTPLENGMETLMTKVSVYNQYWFFTVFLSWFKKNILMPILMTIFNDFDILVQVSKQVRTTGSMPYQLSSLNSATRIRHSCFNFLWSMSRNLTVVVATSSYSVVMLIRRNLAVIPHTG